MADLLNDFQRIGDEPNTTTATTQLGAELRQKAQDIRAGKQWLADRVNFGYELNDKDYGLMTSILSNTDADWNTEISKIEQSLMFSKRDDIPFSVAYSNIDALTQAELGKAPVYDKTRTKEIRDSFEIGQLTILRSEISNKLMKEEMAEETPKYRNFAYKKTADQDKIKEYKEQLAAIDEQMTLLQGKESKSMLTNVLKATAQSLPYTVDVLIKSAAVGIGAFALGGAVAAPGAFVGTGGLTGESVAAGVASANTTNLAASAKLLGSALAGASSAAESSTLMALAQGAYGKAASVEAWKRTSDLSTGSVFYDLRQKGVEKDIAYGVASINGVIQGAIETSLGVIPAMGRAAKVAMLGEAAGASLSAKVFAGLYARGWLGGLAAGVTNILTTAAGEGAEEFFQGIADNLAEYTALTISKETGYTFDKSAGDVLKEAMYEGVMGFASALLMGGVPAVMNTLHDVGYAKNLKKDAENIPSKNFFINKHSQDEQFSGLGNAERKEALAQIYEKNHDVEGISNAEAKNLDSDYMEINEVSEQADETEEEPVSSPAPKTPLKRRKDGRLHTQESMNVEHRADGKDIYTLKLGSAENRYRYGRIEYSIDNGTVRIEDVFMKPGQQELTGEFVTELMRRYPGYNVEWDAKTDTLQKVKDQLISENAVNPDKLQRFLGKGDINERLKVREYIQGKVKEAGGTLTTPQAELYTQLLAKMAEGRKMTLSEAASKLQFKTFEEAGDLMTEEEKAGNKGAFQLLNAAGQGIIYVGKNSDISTLFHELVHYAVQTDFEGAERLATSLKNAAKTEQFRKYIDQHYRIMKNVTKKEGNVVKGLTTDEIIQAIETMDDNPMNWTATQHEVVAVLGETYAQEGRSFNKDIQSILDKFIDFFYKIYRLMKQNALLNDEIIEAYDNLFSPELKEKFEAQEQAETQGKVNFQPTPAEIAEAERQYNEVVAKYKGTSEWLKAPNGQPTKLTERQWVQVRTPNFKKWFGDWENDPDNASEVVDENGEPLVVYHATKRGTPKFDIFKDFAMQGFHFGTKEQARNRAKGRLYAAFLNARNIERRYDQGADWSFTIKYHPEDVDGYIYDNEAEGEGDSYVVFSPNQIKSATDNVGTFSQSNPSILFQTDAEYEEAVKSGDIEKAQAMLAEEAERKGYSADSDYQGSLAFNGSAPAKNGYYNTKEERKEAWDNGEYEGAEFSLGDFVDNKIDTHDLEWELDNPIPASARDPKTLASIRNLANVVKNKKRTIKMYRAVDSDIKENSFRNGDWITPSKEYAKNHITLQDWKKGRVIEQEVSIDDIWWNGDDINEWGYDDGKGYVYKNTPNNRKLFEITYDENGNLIPLSQRFNDSHSSLLFQSAYHGSGASFDKFDTDFMGTGEGAQAFGWGIYLTQSEGIARDYAERLAKTYRYTYKGEAITPSFTDGKSYAAQMLNGNDNSITRARRFLTDKIKSIDRTLKRNSIDGVRQLDAEYRAELEKNAKIFKEALPYLDKKSDWTITPNRNLYTVSIPDDTGSNYLYWDKKYFDSKTREANDQLESILAKMPNKMDLLLAEISLADGEGKDVYIGLSRILGSDKAASEFLSSLGFVGIDYPANSMSGGNKYGKRNFVIFNADDITINNHLMWQGLNQDQVESDMLADAKDRALDEWLDFNRTMAFGEPIDEQYLTAIWEKANNITETADGEKVVDTSTLTEEEKDNAFASIMQTEDGVKGFLKAARDMYTYMRNLEREGVSDEEDRDYLNRLYAASSEFETKADNFMVTFVKGNKSIDDIDPKFLKSLQGKILKNKTEYRGLFAAITDNENMSVGEQELPFIDEPSREKMEHMTISEKRKFVDKLRDADAEKKILSGKETYEGAAENIIKRKNEEIAEQKKVIADKQKEIDREFDLLTSQQKKIVRQAEEQKEIQKKVNELSASIRAKLDKGVRIPTEEYQKLNSLEDRLKLIKEEVSQLNEQTKLKALVEKREALAKLKADIKEKEKERRAAQAIHDYKVKLVTYIQKKVGKNIWWEQAEAIKAIQAALDPTGYDNFFITYNGERMNLTAFRSMVDRSVTVDKDGNVKMAELSPYQWRRYLNKDLFEYTIQDLEEMYDTVRYLKKVGREAWQQRVDQRNYEAQQWQNRIINEFMATGRYVSPSDVPLPETAEALKQEKNLWNMIRTGWYKTINMARKAQIMDGGTKAAIYKLLVSDKRDVQNAEYEAISKRIKPIEKLMKDLGVKPEDFYEKHTLKIGNTEQTYTLSQLIYGVKAQIEERNKLAVMGGNLITQKEKEVYGHNNQTLEAIAESRYQQFIEQAKEILKGKDKVVKIADAIWNDWQNKNNFNRLNEAAIEEYNMPVDPVQFYMPIARKDFNGTELAQKIADDIFNQNAGKNRTSVDRGMTKSRIDISLDKQMPVDMDFFKLWTDSVKDQEHFIATNAYVRKLNRVFKAFGSKDLRASIESAFGRGMLTDIDNYINEVANPDVANDTQGVNKFLSILRGALYPAYLAFKSSSVILQMITSPAPFLREVGPLELAKGLIQMSIHPVATWEYVTGLSSFMENRSMNPLMDEVEAAAKRYNDPRWLQIKHKLQEYGTSGLEMADRWAVTAGWLAVFDKKQAEYLAEGMDEKAAEKKAVKYADDVVYETQPLGDKTELAPLFKVGGPAWQAFTQFQVSLNVIWNNLTYDVAVNDIRNKEYRKLAGTIIGYALAGVILYSVQEGWGTDDDDTPDEKLKKMLKAIAYGSTTQFTSAVPLLSNNADAILKKIITGEKWSYRTNQLYPGFDELAMGVATTNWKKVLSGAAKLGGVPVSGPKEFYHVVHGKEAGDWRFYPQALLGRREK